MKPVISDPKGCTERKLEQDRPRPTTDASHPQENQGIFDTDGNLVRSLNAYCNDAEADGVSGCDSCHWESELEGMCTCTPRADSAVSPSSQTSSPPAWWAGIATWDHVSWKIPKEYKPRVSHVMQDSVVLKVPAMCNELYGGEPAALWRG